MPVMFPSTVASSTTGALNGGPTRSKSPTFEAAGERTHKQGGVSCLCAHIHASARDHEGRTNTCSLPPAPSPPGLLTGPSRCTNSERYTSAGQSSSILAATGQCTCLWSLQSNNNLWRRTCIGTVCAVEHPLRGSCLPLRKTVASLVTYIHGRMSCMHAPRTGTPYASPLLPHKQSFARLLASSPLQMLLPSLLLASRLAGRLLSAATVAVATVASGSPCCRCPEPALI